MSDVSVQELSNQLRAHLHSYTALSNSINNTLKDVNQIQSELDTDHKPLPIVRARLERSYETVGDQAVDEIRQIDHALESIDRLIEQLSRVAPSAAGFESSPTSPNSNALSVRRGTYKKQKRTTELSDSPVYSTSELPMDSLPTTSIPTMPVANAAPVIKAKAPMPSSPAAPPSGMGLGALPSNSSSTFGFTSTASSSSVHVEHASTNTPTIPPPHKKPTLKSRREALANQLPLKAGRQVAFRPPKKGADAGKEEWILARIESCLSGDKNKYMVFDVDYDPTNPTPEAGRFSTTLKLIVPLPDIRDRKATYPENDYAKGTQVMALYPDTTSFYSAKIVAGPLHDKGKKKDKVYHVVFDEDGGKIEPVPIELVVEIPS